MTNHPVRNAAVRKCLQELMTLRRDCSAEELRGKLPTTATFASVSLERRKLIERELRAKGECSDFDSLALGAFQEALREAVVIKGLGINLTLSEVSETLQKTEVLDLWCLFVKHYVGNIFEWRAVAARVDRPEAVKEVRKYGEKAGEGIKRHLRAKPSRNREDIDSFLDAFLVVAARKAE